MTADLAASPERAQAPSFPPLLSGQPAEGGDPFAEAQVLAAAGCDAGLILHRVTPERLSAALVLAPEVPLARAMAMLPVAGIGLQNALGALAPPEVGVHLTWEGAVLVNGGRAGRLRAAAETADPAAVPDWLVIGIELDFVLGAERPGDHPDRTALYEEGCGELMPLPLLEAWARHMLVWLHRWEEEGNRPVHAEWRGLLDDLARDPDFTGLDEAFGKLETRGDQVRLVPLTALLQAPEQRQEGA